MIFPLWYQNTYWGGSRLCKDTFLVWSSDLVLWVEIAYIFYYTDEWDGISRLSMVFIAAQYKSCGHHYMQIEIVRLYASWSRYLHWKKEGKKYQKHFEKMKIHFYSRYTHIQQNLKSMISFPAFFGMKETYKLAKSGE